MGTRESSGTWDRCGSKGRSEPGRAAEPER